MDILFFKNVFMLLVMTRENENYYKNIHHCVVNVFVKNKLQRKNNNQMNN